MSDTSSASRTVVVETVVGTGGPAGSTGRVLVSVPGDATGRSGGSVFVVHPAG